MFPSVESKDSYTGTFWFIFAGMLWLILYLSSVQSFATAYTCVKWYFHHDNSDAEGTQVDYKIGIEFAVSTHMGTIAFGSALITISQVIKFIFEWFAKQAENIEQGEVTGIRKCFITATRCCVHCVDCCIRFMSDNAYI